MSVLAAGAPAPEFTLRDEKGAAFTRGDLEGQTTVLVFYPFAFSPTCTDQLNLYEEVRGDFAARGATLYGVSCDSGYAQAAFREKLGVTMPQLSDFEPKGATCAAFGVLHPGGFAERALVITDAEAAVRWSWQGENPGVLPGANLIFDGLAALS